jgi:peptidoglycan/xylan/chitin deacetylase (PgdA/CDA1 family)
MYIRFFYFLFFIFLSGCQENSPKINNGGVILTFDDFYTENWLKADSELSKFQWKATFGLWTNKLSPNDWNNIKQLSLNGHEIANHSYNHTPAYSYDNQISDYYLENEIYPANDLFKSYNIKAKVFFYPSGRNSIETDSNLLTFFDYLRDVADFNTTNIKENKYYKQNDKVIIAYGIDTNRKITDNELISVLNFCKENNKIIAFYSHNVCFDSEDCINKDGGVTSLDRLKVISNYIKENNMKFYRFKDLYKEN